MTLLLILGLLLVILEIGLRVTIGFGNPLIYVTDASIGYLLAPNQKTRRFGNQIEINAYSMRSGAIANTPESGTLRILLLGDSIANGGWWTDQSQTISAMMTRQLEPLEPEYQAIEILNASANSWCPRNQSAYVQKFGTFGAQAVILLINTDDLFGTAPTSVPVGRDRFYPDHKPPLALIEALTRFLPYQPPPEMAIVNAEKGDRVGCNLEAITQIYRHTQQTQSELLLAMTPLLREVGQPGPRDYEIIARNRLMELTQKQGISYIDFLPLFNKVPQPETLYRDHIHLSPSGNELVSQVLSRQLAEAV